ncbi:outer membrane beta-barrel protein [Candidatus Ruminimicrobium bovinum]|uniref:outer membrane beta-barrel protein n=1 Tax=Candidatus Ruminimicrobium bovinum TaxID=3242779 RepID=UPI0039B8A48F
MKKIFTALLLAVALVAPALASDTNLELIPKIGYLFSPEVTIDNNGKKESFSSDSAISVGADLFFDMENNFFLGIGLVWGQNHKVDSKSDNKIGFTNLYAAIKYKFLVNGSQDDPCFIYPLAQLGIGLAGWNYSGPISNYEIESGFYWALGVGGEFKNIILELIYGCDYGKQKGDGVKSVDLSYTAFRINVGYKFNL